MAKDDRAKAPASDILREMATRLTDLERSTANLIGRVQALEEREPVAAGATRRKPWN